MFISYSHKNTKQKEQLVKHLGVLEKDGLLELWDDQKNAPGDNWRAELNEVLNNTHAAIMLISADFLTSDFIMNEEVPVLLERRRKKDLRIIPLIVEPCAWKRIQWLQEIQAVDLSTIVSDYEIDKNFAKVTDKVYEALGLDSETSGTRIADELRKDKLGGMNTSLPLYIEINKHKDQYSGSIHQGSLERAFSLPDLRLDGHVKPLKDHEWTLNDLVEAITKFNHDDLKAFDARVQLEAGQYLYEQTLGRLPESQQKQILAAKEIEVRILSEDEWIVRLPWNVLSYKGIFRAASGCSVSVSSQLQTVDCELPPSPRILVIAPQPTGAADTKAKDHLEALEDMLSSHDQLLSFGNNLQAANTWEDFVDLTKEFKPQLVYYYGHGIGDGTKTRLVFVSGKALQRVDKPIADFAHCLRNMEKPPMLAYLNCCRGDAGGFPGAGMQLGGFIPAVITNRTAAQISVAQTQAMTLWKNILLRAVPPHKAVAGLYAGMDTGQLSTTDIRWINPVLYCHYSQWQATQPAPPDRLTQDPHWHLKIDRVKQYNSAIAQTRLMMREQKPKSLVFTWYGQEGQGIEIFHKRLLVELREELSNAFVYQVRPAWPLHLENYHTSFSDILTQAFGVNSLEDIPARIRSESHGSFGKQSLVYVRHEPVTSSQLINPESLKTYVQWWDKEFAPLLEKNQFALLSVSFIVKNPPAFTEYIEDEKIDELDTKHTVFWLLDEMEEVAKKDLLLFLRTHNIDLPKDRRDKVLQNILKKTGGRYEHTIDELKKLRRDAWSVGDDSGARATKAGGKKFDY